MTKTERKVRGRVEAAENAYAKADSDLVAAATTFVIERLRRDNAYPGQRMNLSGNVREAHNRLRVRAKMFADAETELLKARQVRDRVVGG